MITVEPTKPGRRDGALRVIVMSTDAEFHDPTTTDGDPGAGSADALAAIHETNTGHARTPSPRVFRTCTRTCTRT